MSIKEKKNSNKNPHKLKFGSQMEFLNNSEVKKMKDKNLHLFIFEEIEIVSSTPVKGEKSSSQGIIYSYRPLLDCSDLAVFDETDKTHKFPGVSLMSSLLE